MQCSNCFDGYYGDPLGLNGPAQTCINCNCNKNGSLNDICSNNGICSCKANVTGDKCTYCDQSLFPFPNCDRGENITNYLKIRLISKLHLYFTNIRFY